MGHIYTQMKIFHFKNKIDSLKKEIETIKSPIHIRLKPTNVCNHNCSYCAYRAEGLQLGQNMRIKDYIPEDKMMEIIDDIIEMKVKAVTFSGGGEPFCYPYLLKTVQKLSHSDVKFASLTNGANLTGEVAEVFAKNATWLRVSIDGYDDLSYSKYRNVKSGEFEKVIKNIENFAKIKEKCLLGVSIIVNKENAKHIYKLTEILKNICVDTVKIAPCIVSNSGAENNIYHKSIYNMVKEEIKKTKNSFENSNFEIFDSYHNQLESFEKDYDWCPFLQILPVIGADLNIYPCQDKAYNLDTGLIGSIKNVRFKDFWFSDKNKFFKVNPSKHCNHHCVANGKNKMILDYLNADNDHLGFV